MTDTTRAWLAGWDAATASRPANANPYKRMDFIRAWDRGFKAGTMPDDMAVRVMKRKVNKVRPGTYQEA